MRRIIAAAALLAALAACEFSIGGDGNGSTNGSVPAGGSAGAPMTTRFVNSPENARSDPLRQNYVDFSFEYPSNWTVTPQPTDGSARNFVRVAAPFIDGYEPFAFHVGYAYGSGNAETDRRDLEQALPQIAQQFGTTMPEYRITSIGGDRVGEYDSFNWRFSASAPGINGGAPARIWGRGDIILPPGATRGVLILSLVTDRTNEVDDPSDVGESGTLKAVYDSFRLGSSGAGGK